MPFFFMSLLFLWALWERWGRFQQKEYAERTEAVLLEAREHNLRVCRRLLAERKGDTPEARREAFEFCRSTPVPLVYMYVMGNEVYLKRDEPPFELAEASEEDGSFSDRSS